MTDYVVVAHRLYIISDIENKRAKIGVSYNPPERLRQIRMQEKNSKLFLHKVYILEPELAFAMESQIKCELKCKRVKGTEWFSVTATELEGYVNIT